MRKRLGFTKPLPHPQGFWKTENQQRAFFHSLTKQLAIKNLSQWYSITVQQVKQLGGGRILFYYNDSLICALQHIYPHHHWLAWKFLSVSNKFWESLSNQMNYFDWFSHQFGIDVPHDWYNIKLKDVKENFGGGLIANRYSDSLPLAYQSLFPELCWDAMKVLKRKRVKVGPSHPNIRTLCSVRGKLESLGSELKVKSFGELLSVRRKKQEEFSSSYFLRMIVHTFPEIFLPKRSPRSRDLDISKISEVFDLQCVGDWYRVSIEKVKETFGYSFLSLSHLVSLFRRQFPEHSWKSNRFFQKKKKCTQRDIFLMTNKIFPGIEVKEDFYHPHVLHSDTTNPVELDVYVPELGIALEFQGEQHYINIEPFGMKSGAIRAKDVAKYNKCKNVGISLISVPYFWDGSLPSLIRIILNSRPEMMSQMEKKYLELI